MVNFFTILFSANPDLELRLEGGGGGGGGCGFDLLALMAFLSFLPFTESNRGLP